MSSSLVFFSYFTILTNIFCCMAFSVSILSPLKYPVNNNAFLRFFTKQEVLSTLAASIILVAIVYYLVLAATWQPTGWDYLTDLYLHLISPIFFLLFWLSIDTKKPLQLTNMMLGAVYPICYIIYVFARGQITGLYPYPFINLTELGLAKTLINCSIIFLAFEAITVILFATKHAVNKLLYSK